MYKNPEPYWNFWKVVFAGWLIKYPGKFFRAIVWILIALAVGVMYIVDGVGEGNGPKDRDTEGIEFDNTDNREYNEIERLYGLE